MITAMFMVVIGCRSTLAWSAQYVCAKFTVMRVGSARLPSILGVNSIVTPVISKRTKTQNNHLQCPQVAPMAGAHFG